MEDTKRSTVIARTLAVLVAAAGAYFVVTMVISIPRILQTPNGAFDIFFLFIFPLPFSAFGIYCIYSGCRLWFKLSPENARRISFVTAIIVFFLLLPMFSFVLKSDESYSISTPLLMIAAGIFYLFFNRSLIRLLNLPTAIDWVQREKSAKRFFGWFAFFLWSSAFQLLNIYLPPKNFGSDPLKELLYIFFPIGAIVMAYGIYKLGAKIALRNKPKESEISPYPSAPATGS